MTELYLNTNQTARILRSKPNETIVLKFMGVVLVEDYKFAMELLLKLAKEYQYHRIIFDLSDAESTPAIGRAWFITQYGPRAYRELGKKLTVCMLLSQRSAFQNKASELVARSMQALKMNINISFTDDMDNALDWCAKAD